MAAAEGLTEHCTQGHAWSGEPRGEVTKLGSLPAYHSKGRANVAVLFITDIFGWSAQNNRLAADGIAKLSGFNVYVPDFFQGDIFDRAEAAAFFERHSPAAVQPLLEEAVASLRERHPGRKLGAVGYCWGGRHSLRLGVQGHVAAAVQCHPSLVNPQEDNLAGMQAACLFLLAAGDKAFEGSRREDAESAIKTAGAPLEVKEFEGVVHGFAVRCDEGDSHSAQARDDALADTAAWFQYYLE